MDVNFHYRAFYRRNPYRPHRSGYTLVELVATLGIAAILLGLSFPSLQSFVQQNRMAAYTNNLVGSLHLARSEAVKRGHSVVVCKSPDGATCDSAAQWEDGWIVFSDPDNTLTPNHGEPPLRTVARLGGQVTLDFSAFGSSNHVIWLRTGSTRNNGTFTFCDPRGPAEARTVILSRSGRVRLAKTTGSGNPAVCPIRG